MNDVQLGTWLAKLHDELLRQGSHSMHISFSSCFQSLLPRVTPAVMVFSLLVSACESNPIVNSSGSSENGNGSGGKEGEDGGENTINLGGDAPGDGDGDGDGKPQASVCGNSKLEIGELCDDGNTKNGDGCSKDCLEQDPDYDCSVPGEKCKNTVICGNGVLEGDEACDDGNETSGDGCSKNCSTVEEGYGCARPGRECLQLPVCGNGVRERGEQCDDGEAEPDGGDGCDADCQEEAGFFCITPGQPCVPLVCGDGVRTPDEQCDDGDNPPVAGDGCSATCTVEDGYRCNSSGCTPVCGDGKVTGSETCDQGESVADPPQSRVSGDGCSAACQVEPFYACTGAPSNCTSTIGCNNGTLDPGEICDVPGVNGCNADCTGFSPDPTASSVCGNGVIEAGETCDAPNVGKGCSATCQVESNFTCPRPNTCFADPKCGDGILHSPLGEFCDDGNNNPSDGCNACNVTPGYNCFGLAPSVCVQEICGDGTRTPGEDCDDGNPSNGDGCTGCTVDTGYVCPNEGALCVEKCGDAQRVGNEECDDGNRSNDDGCNSGCRLEPGYTCDDATGVCSTDVCGDSVKDASEGCDDGNDVAGDGCSATCQKEPTITVGPAPTVVGSCGDGLLTGSEVCDDGNTDNGDGCKADCSGTEADYTCTEFVNLPDHVNIAVTYRDFKADHQNNGHPDFEWEPNPSRRNMPGPVCTTSNTTACVAAPGAVCPANTCARLDAQGKPVHHLTGNDSDRGRVTSAATFALWYRDTNATNTAGANGVISMQNLKSSLRLNQVTAGSDTYEFDSSSHFPLDGKLFGNYASTGHNYHFTSEIRYFFQYKGGETLTFRGDDDVWVFVNGRLAVDIGGVHGAQGGRVILGDDGDGGSTDSNCSNHGTTPGTCSLQAGEIAGIADDKRFGLVEGELYEIVLFHAERHTSGSNFKLTLEGFLAPRSFCQPTCGDGKLLPGEVCDDGTASNTNTDNDDPSDDVSGVCNDTCTGRAYCGDGELNISEVCDNGENLDVYLVSSDPNACAPGCKSPPSCGDGVVQAAYESCDRGAANDDNSYGPLSCTTSCGFGGYCGDGMKQSPEACDLGANNGGYGPGSCGYDCTPGPYCGDGVRNGSEQCDGTQGCTAQCTQGPYCGDGVANNGEVCDWGQFASSAYGGCNGMCQSGPRCGDGMLDTPYEECDDGVSNANGEYDGCSSTCSAGPRCGDGEVQVEEGEVCDNGFNDDTYRYDEDSCAAGCQRPPECGDGKVQPADESCDNGAKNSDSAYDGCSTSCEWGPYCGDGKTNGPESCDDGAQNTAYSASGKACGYDCQPAPYCGDGVRNGPEQCDDGKDKNVGGYGKCTSKCKRGPYCGDGIVQRDQGEDCDGGVTGSLDCSVLCRKRDVVK